MACLAVLSLSVITDDNVSDDFKEGVKLLSCDVVLAVAEVIIALFVAVTSAVVVILDENIGYVVVFRVDSKDDSNSVLEQLEQQFKTRISQNQQEKL